MKKKAIDTPFLAIALALSLIGFLLFFSVALGTLNSTSTFILTISKQFIALTVGLGAMFLIAYHSKIDYKMLKYGSLVTYIGAVLFQLLVFVPGVGVTVNGAQRWISIFGFSVQPSEVLKVATIIFLSALLAQYGKKMQSLKSLILVCGMALGLSALMLFVARDIGTLLVLSLSSLALLLIAPTKKRYVLSLVAVAVAGLLFMIYFFRRYAWDRLLSFTGQTNDALGSDFQINQSLYTIGSGEIFGRGFGQSLQKFAYLPEPLNDSIFAVTAEEWGFIGSLFVIALFLTLLVRGLSIARKSRDVFGTYLVTGLVLLIVAQSFINIAAMLKLFPLSGMPLIFISQGGSALVMSLVAIGIILNVSRYAKK